MERQAGAMLNASSLPGKYGIGDFSRNCEHVLNEFAAMGFKVWQTLPVTCLGKGDSPYCGISAHAGNFLYIDLERLDGLLTASELKEAEYGGGMYLADYGFCRETKGKMLRLAYSRLDGAWRERIDRFAAENRDWLEDYAVFMTLRKLNGGKAWNEWSVGRKRDDGLVREVLDRRRAETYYYFFEQCAFFEQWARIRKHARDLGMLIFGDIPMYVSCDSVDVWAAADMFRLDADLRPVAVSGVPPDYFCEDGQLWGNPLYDYARMERDGFAWWISRIRHTRKLYDILRIDHFRGFSEYWEIPANSNTAKTGRWRPGPGMKLFDALEKAEPGMRIVAEDLGIVDEKVEELLAQTGFPGMRVFQFGFDGDRSNRHLPHNYDKNCVAYTATHDNETTLGWLLGLAPSELDAVLSYVNCDPGFGWADGAGKCRATRSVIRAVMASSANLAIVPMQDLCGYGNDTRMNTPGVSEGCWRYRTNYSALNGVDGAFVKGLISAYGRG